MPWKPFEFKGQKVYVRVLDTGKPIVRRGLVELRYKLGATKSYRTQRENLGDTEDEIIPDSDMGGREAASAKALKESPSKPADEDTVVIYTDGACSGNPGPAGIGVYMKGPRGTLEVGEFLGSGTNNIAELTAILRGLEELSDEERQKPVHLYTDSAWSLGVLIGGWKAKTNLTLIEKIKAQMESCSHLELLKVRGHAGDPGNEEADHLATTAVRRESSLRKERPKK